MALRRAGFHAEVASPTYGYLGRSAAPVAWHRLRPWRLLYDLSKAVRRARPDRLVPCDDVSTALMVKLHADPATRGVVCERIRPRSASRHIQGWHDAPWDDLPLLRSALGELALTACVARLRTGLEGRLGR